MRNLAIRINLLLLLWMLATCGANARQKTIDVAFTTLNAARTIYVTYDLERQNQIVDAALTKAEAEQQLQAYRARRERVLAKFVTAYRLLATAALVNDDASIVNMLAAVGELQQAIKAFREGGEP